MDKRTKRFLIFTVVLSLALCLAGCGNSGTTDHTGGSTGKTGIAIEDIDWNVDEGIVDGKRYVVMNYTNNTPYTITHLQLKFKEKTGITDAEKAEFYSNVQEVFDLSDEKLEEWKSWPMCLHTETDRVVDPGQSVSNIRCYYFMGIYYLMNIDIYKLFEPDIATVKYIDGDQIFTAYYDYQSGKYSVEERTELACQWPQAELSSNIPKPDVKVIENRNNSEKIYSFEAYGVSPEQFDDYIAQCKELGYTVDPRDREGLYSADNAEGYEARLSYRDENHCMSCSFSAPETQSE